MNIRYPKPDLLIVFMAVLLISIPIQGMAESNSGGFMRFSTSARASALGQAGITVIEGPASVYWNPANLYAVKSKQLLLLHSQYFIDDVNYDFASYTMPTQEATIAIAIARLGVDEIADTRKAKFITRGGDWRLDYSKVSYFSTADYMAYFSYAAQWNEKISWGVNAKLLYRDFSTEKAFGLGFDAGMSYRLNKNFQFAAVIQDFTTSPIFYSTNKSEFSIPRIRVGAAYHYSLEKLNILLTPTVQMDMTFDDLPGAALNAGPLSFDFPLGLEISYKTNFSLRTGMDANKRPSLGAGFSLGSIRLDYAFSSYGDDLGNINVISINVDFDQLFAF